MPPGLLKVLPGEPYLVSRYGRLAMMEPSLESISHKHHRFLADVIRHARVANLPVP